MYCSMLAGTEDGHIHKCSTSYSEQYLETYHGHIGPVYGLQWSPFNPSLFVSCSGDWTIRMWQEGRQAPLMTFQSSNKEVGQAHVDRAVQRSVLLADGTH
jgi:WD40 repeat protein